MTWRTAVRALAVGICFAVGAPGHAKTTRPLEVVPLSAEREDAPDILVVHSGSATMRQCLDAMALELKADFDVLEVVTSSRTKAGSVAAAIVDGNPSLVVLMDNPNVDLYREATADCPEAARPAVVVMALFLEQTVGGLDNGTGIFYEVPAVTSLVNLRRVALKPFTRIGVIHRPQFAEIVERQAFLAGQEGFDMTTVQVDGPGRVGAVKRALRSLDEAGVEALWVLNDNRLLQPELLQWAWFPIARRTRWPTLVGVESLLNPHLDFGTFGVLPDHISLGMQAAELIYEVSDAGFDARQVPLQMPIGVETVLNREIADKRMELTPSAELDVDRVLRNEE